MQGRRVADKPTQVHHISSLHVVTDGTVITAVGKVLGDGIRHFDLLCDLQHGVALIGHAQGFIIDEAIHIPLRADMLIDLVLSPH